MEHEWMVSLGVFDRRLNQEALLVEQWDKPISKIGLLNLPRC